MLTQRLGTVLQKNPDYVDALIKQIKNNEGSCDEVWLSSQYGFPKLEVHKQSAEALIETADKFRAAGIRVSLQISNTIGHGQYMSEMDCSGLVYDGSPVEKMVGADGTVAEYCFCPNGEHFREYTIEAIKPYLAIKPYAVWIDDDFRMGNHDPVSRGCFCEKCIEKFNTENGYNFTREELVKAINEGELLVRKNYVAFIRESLGELMRLIAGTVHEISPESRMGLQHCHSGYTGLGLSHIFDAMRDATGFAPLSRPGGGVYNDNNPQEILNKARCIAWQNYILPDYIEEIRPEIENLPDTVFSKTAAGTAFETSVYLAYGANAMSYAMLMEDYEPLSFHAKTLEKFSNCKPYWTKLAKANINTTPAGLTAITSQNEYLRIPKENEPPFSWCGENYDVYSSLTVTAIPIAFGKSHKPVYILHPYYAATMSLKEADFLMDKPVVTDGESLRILSERGFEFSATSSPVDTSMLYEVFSEHPVNKDFAGKKWSQSFFIKEGSVISGNGEILGVYGTNSRNCPENSDGKYPYGIADAIVKAERGALWAVFGHSPWNGTISLDRRNQIINAADYISDNRLPAVLTSPQKAVLLPREDKDGYTTSVSIINCTIGKAEMLKLKIRKPLRQRFLYMKPGMDSQTELNAINVGGDWLVTVPSIEPWSVGTVFISE